MKLLALFGLAIAATLGAAERRLPLPAMHWADASRGRPFSKDPSVVRDKGRTRYLSHVEID